MRKSQRPGKTRWLVEAAGHGADFFLNKTTGRPSNECATRRTNNGGEMAETERYEIKMILNEGMENEKTAYFGECMEEIKTFPNRKAAENAILDLQPALKDENIRLEVCKVPLVLDYNEIHGFKKV